MGYIQGADRNQAILLPDPLDDYVSGDTRDMLKLYMYGYMNHIRSSRRLQKEASRNVELMWLLRKVVRISAALQTSGKIMQNQLKKCSRHL